MSMRKVAVYVEGMTELVFVYHTIFAHYQSDWTAFHLDFVNSSPSAKIGLQHPYGDENADNHFFIYNCGSDESVIPTMIERFPSHMQQGFSAVVGLRDINGSRYFDIYKAGHEKIEWPKVNAMMRDLESTVASADPSGSMAIRFSIMEIEAWLLAMPEFLTEVFPGFPYERVAAIDPELTYVHPFGELNGMVPYEKHFDLVESVFSRITSDHLEALSQSGRCASFKRFYECVFN